MTPDETKTETAVDAGERAKQVLAQAAYEAGSTFIKAEMDMDAIQAGRITGTPSPHDNPQPPPPPAVVERKIVICGYAPSVRDAPWNTPGYELWGLNDMHATMPRVPDVLFEIHDPAVIKAEGHWETLAKLTVPIYMQAHYDDIPTSVEYPLATVRNAFTLPGLDRPFITCSASSMLAVALLQVHRPTEIHMYGVEMAMDTEFSVQRPSCEFFLGVAHGLGIKVFLQPKSDLLKTRFLYGFERPELDVFRAQLEERAAWLQANLAQATNEEQAAKEKRLQYEGATADLLHIRKRYGYA